MTTTTGDQLLSDYLARLDAAALRLPPDRRSELMEGIAEHVAAARAAGELRDEAAVRTLLDRLGEPEEIVAAAGEELPAGGWGSSPWGAQGPQLVQRRPGTGLETAAVLMLTVGSLIPIAGWLVGVVLLWTSSRWRVSEKLVGTLVVPGGPGILLPLSLMPVSSSSCVVSVAPAAVPGSGAPEDYTPPPTSATETCESSALLPQWLLIALLLVVLVAPIVVAVILLRRARARAEAEPPVLRQVGTGTWTGNETAAVLILALGFFVAPFVAGLVALVFVWRSQRWTDLEKGVATVLTVLPVGLVVLAVAGGPFVLPFGLFAVAFFAIFGQLIAAGYLALVLNRRGTAAVR